MMLVLRGLTGAGTACDPSQWIELLRHFDRVSREGSYFDEARQRVPDVAMSIVGYTAPVGVKLEFEIAGTGSVTHELVDLAARPERKHIVARVRRTGALEL